MNKSYVILEDGTSIELNDITAFVSEEQPKAIIVGDYVNNLVVRNCDDLEVEFRSDSHKISITAISSRIKGTLPKLVGSAMLGHDSEITNLPDFIGEVRKGRVTFYNREEEKESDFFPNDNVSCGICGTRLLRPIPHICISKYLH